MARRSSATAAFTLILAAVAALLTGCSGDSAEENLPDAAGLLAEASTATAEIRSAHFALQTNGKIPGIGVQALDGDLTKDGGPKGGAKGTGKLEMSGQLVEVEFVLSGDSLYLKGPTGKFQKLPVALGASIYDPSAVLDPERGIGKVLTSMREPRTEEHEDLDGTPAYKVTGSVPGAALSGLLPGTQPDAEVTFWLNSEGKRLPLKASVTFAGEPPSTVDVTVSDVDKPVTVTPPA